MVRGIWSSIMHRWHVNPLCISLLWLFFLYPSSSCHPGWKVPVDWAAPTSSVSPNHPYPYPPPVTKKSNRIGQWLNPGCSHWWSESPGLPLSFAIVEERNWKYNDLYWHLLLKHSTDISEGNAKSISDIYCYPGFHRSMARASAQWIHCKCKQRHLQVDHIRGGREPRKVLCNIACIFPH